MMKNHKVELYLTIEHFITTIAFCTVTQIVAKQDSPVLFLNLNLYLVHASVSVSSHCDVEVLVITRLEWPPKAHGGLTTSLFQREESVTLQYVQHRHGFSSGVIVLMDET